MDEVLDDLGANIPARVRAGHWLNPVDPAAYRDVAPRVLAGLPAPAPVPADPGRAVPAAVARSTSPCGVTTDR